MIGGIQADFLIEVKEGFMHMGDGWPSWRVLIELRLKAKSFGPLCR